MIASDEEGYRLPAVKETTKPKLMSNLNTAFKDHGYNKGDKKYHWSPDTQLKYEHIKLILEKLT